MGPPVGPGVRGPPGCRAELASTASREGRARREQMLNAYLHYLELGLPIILALVAAFAIGKIIKSV